MIKFKYSLLIGFFMGLSLASQANNSNQIQYDGTLISLPCTINEETETFVDLGEIIDKNLYLYGQSKPVPFYIILQDCDPLIASSVTLSVKAAENSITQDGYLTLNPKSDAKGIVIGLSDNTGKQIPLNSKLSPIKVSEGAMAIRLNAFVKLMGTEENGLIPGKFTSTLYYTLDFN